MKATILEIEDTRYVSFEDFSKMEKTKEQINERYIKDKLEALNQDEIDFYAENYCSDLQQQFMDNDLSRLKIYNAEKSDLYMEKEELESIKTFIVDNTAYFRERNDAIIRFINKQLSELSDRLEIVKHELDYITTRMEMEDVI